MRRYLTRKSEINQFCLVIVQILIDNRTKRDKFVRFFKKKGKKKTFGR